MTPAHLRIRPAQHSDEAFLWRMLYHAAHMEQDDAPFPDGAKSNPYLARYVQNWGAPADLGLIGELEGMPVGAAWSRLLEPHEGEPPAEELLPELAVAVEPAYLGQGIGTRLLAAYLEAAEQHFPAVTLTVRAGNPALRLYQRAGFEITGEIVNRVGTRSFAMIRRFRIAA